MSDLNARLIAKASATAAEVPQAADLDVAELALNTADGKLFTKHIDGTVVEVGSGSGGVSGVTSVNGETGVVSLGIQDMDDFELSVLDAIQWQFDIINYSDSTSGHADGKAFIDSTNTSVSPITYDGQDIKAALRAWVSAVNLASGQQDIVFTVDGVDYTVQVTQVDDNLDDTGSYAPRLRLGCQLQAQSGASIGGTLKIKSLNEWATANGSAALAPLADGDTLQWVDAESKFKPTQLPAAPVDSVNGETGVVSLGIQEMDDFALNPAENLIAYHDRKELYWNTVDDYTGGFGIPDDSQVLVNDDDPTSGISLVDQGWTPGDPRTIWISRDGVAWTSHTGPSASTGGTARFYNVIPDVSAYTSDSALYFSVIGPDAGEPLVEGDTLLWNAADQKFKPAQLPSGGGAVDSVNGETGTVVLDLEDINNVKSITSGDLTFASRVTTQGGVDTAGEWYITVGSQDYFYWLATDPNNASMAELQVGDTVTFTDGGSNTSVLTVLTSSEAFGATNRIRFNEAIGDISNISIGSGVTVQSTRFASGDATDGQVLTWVDANNQWEPVTPSGGGGGGAVDSVNGETGDVSLGVQDMDDFALNSDTSGVVIYHHVLGNYNQDGEYQVNGDGLLIKEYDANDTQSVKPTDNGTIYLSADGLDFVSAEISGSVGTAGTSPGGLSNIAWSLTFADPTVYSALGIASGQSLYWSNTPAAGSPIPLAEGDILQWNNTDQKFKPAQLPSGGGGAVDSVNGETGVVSLGIQEMDDFELNTSAGTFTATNKKDYVAAVYASGEWSILNPATEGFEPFFLTDSVGLTEFSGLNVGDSVTFTSGALTPFVSTVHTAVAANTEGNALFRINDEWPSDYLTLADGSSITIQSANLNPSSVPLADGDILQWVDSDQKFKPAQLPSGGGAVDSVNGETGVVSLGIQDMDDFELSSVTGSPLYDSQYGGVPATAGQWQPESATAIRVSPISADGTDYTSQLENHTGTIWYLVDGTDLYSSTYLGWGTVGDGYGRVDVSSGPNTAFVTSYQLFFSDPGTPPFTAPLAEDDILQWNAADQKFKPAQVAQRIQDQGDFELNPSTGVFTWSTCIGALTIGGANVAGEWGGFAGGGGNTVISVKSTDDISDRTAALEAIQAGDVILVNGTSATVKRTDDYISLQGEMRITFESDLGVDFTAGNNPLTLESVGFATGFIFLSDGDILQWDDGDQKFKPAPQPVDTKRIQDMDDFALNVDATNSYTLPGPSTSNPTSSGQWGVGAALDNYFTWFDTDPVHTLLSSINIGDSVQFVTQSGFVHTAVASSVATQNGSTSDYMSFAGYPWPSEITTAQSNNEPITVRPAGVNAIPLTDGDMLQWDNGESKFKPTQPVNTKRIQDQEDFELNAPDNAISITYNNNIGTAGAAPGGAGNFSTYDLSATEILFMVDHEDSSGADALTDLAAWVDLATQYIEIDGVLTAVTLNSSTPRADRYDLLLAKAGSLWTDLSTASTIKVSDGGALAPLADGDIVQWVDAESKFKPAQPVDTKRIQDQEDFELNPSGAAVTWGTYSDSGSGVIDGVNYVAANTPQPEAWHPASGVLYVNRRSDGLYDRSAVLGSLTAGDIVTITDSVGYSVTVTLSLANTDFVSEGGQFDRVSLDWSDYVTWRDTVNRTGSLTIESVKFADGVVPLIEGDILQWDESDQKFKPSSDYISLTALKAEVAASTDFADFQSRIAAL